MGVWRSALTLTGIIVGLAAYRGGQWGLMYAEAFEVVMREY